MGLIKGGNQATIEFAGRVVPWKSSYKILRTWMTGTSTVRGTFRDEGGTSGYAAPAGGYKILAVRGRIMSRVATSYNIIGISQSDNDVTVNSSTALTNGVAIGPDATHLIGLSSQPETQSADPTLNSAWLVGSYTIASGKYLSATAAGSAAEIGVEVLIELL